MTDTGHDPTMPIRAKAASFANVVEGTACSQTSFKVKQNAFLFIGIQVGRYKAMFKLKASRGQAAELATKEPDCYAIGTGVWATVRFTEEKPLPKKVWEKWLNESYQLCL